MDSFANGIEHTHTAKVLTEKLEKKSVCKRQMNTGENINTELNYKLYF